MTQNAANQDYQNNADGFTLGGGTTERKLTVTGGDMTMTGSGTNTFTYPAASDTLVGRASTDDLTNKTLNGNPIWQYLGYAQITTSFTTASTSAVQVTGLSVTVTIPAGSTRVRVTGWACWLDESTAGAIITASLWDGTVGSGTQLAQNAPEFGTNTRQIPLTLISSPTPTAGSKTYNVGLQTTGGTASLGAFTYSPAFIQVECC